MGGKGCRCGVVYDWTGRGATAIPLSGSAAASPTGGRHRQKAQVAQLVEQRTENPRVGGSNPPLGTTHLMYAIDM